MDYIPRLPDQPELRDIAESIERAGMVAEILDERFRCDAGTIPVAVI